MDEISWLNQLSTHNQVLRFLPEITKHWFLHYRQCGFAKPKLPDCKQPSKQLDPAITMPVTRDVKPFWDELEPLGGPVYSSTHADPPTVAPATPDASRRSPGWTQHSGAFPLLARYSRYCLLLFRCWILVICWWIHRSLLPILYPILYKQKKGKS